MKENNILRAKEYVKLQLGGYNEENFLNELCFIFDCFG